MALRKSPSLLRILLVDYWAYLGALFLIIVPGLLTFFVLFNYPVDPLFVVVCAALALAGLLTAAWRIFTITSIFSDGLAVPAAISNVWYFRDRGRVEYTYTFRGQKYRGGNAIHKSRYTRFLESRTDVTVVVDRNNPKRAFIQELYV